MLELFSPAKINLTLKILGKESNGYHQIETLMQAISLGDHITLQKCDRESFSCTSPHLKMDEGNLVVKALRLFQKKTGFDTPISLHLEKKIPMEAGLGGGSSNAATVLWGLNRLSQKEIPDHILMEWSSEIGSDIPFFFSEGTALCEGRGEVVKSIHHKVSEKMTIIKPSYGLSTKEVYRAYLPDECEESSTYFNALEKAAFSIAPQLQALKVKILESGYKQVLLCGSGSSLVCFGEGKIHLPNASVFININGINRKKGSWYGNENI